MIIDEVVEGIFLEELKNRFLCNVLIQGKVNECYVPSASKLKNYININGKKVLLLKNKGDKVRTKFSVFAIMYYGKYIMLNMAFVNKILYEHLKQNFPESIIYREKYIESYKSDFLVISDKKIVIEAKGIIATKRNVIFPTVHSQRAIDQLYNLLELLKQGWKVEYYYISLSPIVRKININDFHFEEYKELLQKCINLGMNIKGFNIYYDKNEIKIGRKLNIEL